MQAVENVALVEDIIPMESGGKSEEE